MKAYREMNMAKSAKNTSLNYENKMMSLGIDKAKQIVTIRVLIILFVDILVCSLFDFVRGNMMRELAFHFNVQPVLLYVFGAALLLSIAYFVLTLVKKIDTSAYFMTPLMILAVCLYLFISVLFYDQFRMTPFLFYTVTVIGSVLFVVYYVYNIIFYKK